MKDMETYEFIFKVAPDNDSGDIKFIMGIGNHSFSSYITGWSNSWERISNSLEEYIFKGQSFIELDFDTEPTTVSMKREGSNILLDIDPSHFTKEKAFNGVCSEKDFLSKLYNGLLYAMTYRYDDVGCGWNWDDCKMVCYNRLKSRTVEEYLRTGVAELVETFVCKHILVIYNKEMLHICDETIGYHIPINEETRICDKNNKEIAIIDATNIKNAEFSPIANSLTIDFDLWTIDKYDDGYIEPHLIERHEKVKQGEVFLKEDYKVKEIGNDPYGFTSDTLWTACNQLDLKGVAHFLSLNADTTYILRWILRSNRGGTYDNVGNPTYDETEESIRRRDKQKGIILRYVLRHVPDIQIKKEHLSECVWKYSPLCLKLLLENGANPNEQEIVPDWHLFAVKYRSVLSTTNNILQNKEDKYGIVSEMKSILEDYGAKDIVIWNEEYPSVQKYKDKEYES